LVSCSFGSSAVALRKFAFPSRATPSKPTAGGGGEESDHENRNVEDKMNGSPAAKLFMV